MLKGLWLVGGTGPQQKHQLNSSSCEVSFVLCIVGNLCTSARLLSISLERVYVPISLVWNIQKDVFKRVCFERLTEHILLFYVANGETPLKMFICGRKAFDLRLKNIFNTTLKRLDWQNLRSNWSIVVSCEMVRKQKWASDSVYLASLGLFDSCWKHIFHVQVWSDIDFKSSNPTFYIWLQHFVLL